VAEGAGSSGDGEKNVRGEASTAERLRGKMYPHTKGKLGTRRAIASEVAKSHH